MVLLLKSDQSKRRAKVSPYICYWGARCKFLINHKKITCHMTASGPFLCFCLDHLTKSWPRSQMWVQDQSEWLPLERYNYTWQSWTRYILMWWLFIVYEWSSKINVKREIACTVFYMPFHCKGFDENLDKITLSAHYADHAVSSATPMMDRSLNYFSWFTFIFELWVYNE